MAVKFMEQMSSINIFGGFQSIFAMLYKIEINFIVN